MPLVASYERYVCDNAHLHRPEYWDGPSRRLFRAERLLQCPYCGGELVRYVNIHFYETPLSPAEKRAPHSPVRSSSDPDSYWQKQSRANLRSTRGRDGYQRESFVAVCKDCGFWFGRGASFDGAVMARSAYGTLRHYEIDSLDVPMRELILYLYRRQNYLTAINPFKAEELMARLLADSLKCEVQRIGGRKDGGVDLVLKANGSSRTIVQIKWHRDVKRAESVRVVRELCGTLVARGVPRGMLVTTRKYLSPEGLSEISDIIASPVAPGLFRIDIADYDRILEMLELTVSKMGSFSAPPSHLVEAEIKNGPMGIFENDGIFNYQYKRDENGILRPANV
jgi:hypothetical protein